MRQAGAVLKLVSSNGETESGKDRIGARGEDLQVSGGAGIEPADTSELREQPQYKGIAMRAMTF